MAPYAEVAASRNFGLDLVRALAILLVLAGHGSLLAFFDDMQVATRHMLIYQGGFFGVELFFVLSGFLIGGILLRLFDNGGARPGHRDILQFWVRRWCRTLPNYYLFLLLNLTLFAAWFGPRGWQWGYFLFLQNLAWPAGQLMPESWSLAVEEWFYLTAPLGFGLACLLLASRRHAMLAAIVTCLLLSNLARLGVVIWTDPSWDEGIRKIVLLRLDSIAWGCLMAWLAAYRADWLSRWRYRLAGAGSVLTLGAILLLAMGVRQGFSPLWHGLLLFTMTSAGFAFLLPAFAHCPRPKAWLAAPITGLSLISYSAYLVHFSLVIPLLRRLVGSEHSLTGVDLVLYPLLTIVISTLVYCYFEKPMTAIRRYIGIKRAFLNKS
ncbi:acyltransferase [Halomonas sp. McH1-25]|uniref:acyltransferase family protein n=1 Tax=unclassified Halomonas TaxID=2609666 RepID=UPI001EF4F588|nr:MULTISPECIES: acyltransferase [unclassified Halomonas]MCG7600468.1 acyltransferase [Halomonas sp. McH1-25]MCP1342933.1 acyltransferase [Halomonas sp. FL8]MCP1359975.1 acyltransferase [Halomonas sp. BBD45]MCP1363901.1 acyltransferase [Halomonas sp. BBD48]